MKESEPTAEEDSSSAANVLADGATYGSLWDGAGGGFAGLAAGAAVGGALILRAKLRRKKN